MSDIEKLRFLVVDDMGVMRKIYKKSLSNLGLPPEKIQEAEDGAVALEILNKSFERDEPVHFVISDWNMPNLTGLELLKNIRSDKRFLKLPFLMVTAENKPENIKEALEAGVDNFIAKPFKPEDLCDRIKSVYNKSCNS